jgi:hypothetical protein
MRMDAGERVYDEYVNIAAKVSQHTEHTGICHSFAWAASSSTWGFPSQGMEGKLPL